jgi:phospholipid/cholesterol/gamma-HCH transport system substrate-binding protein
LSVDKTAPVTSASVATITSRGLATRGFTGYVYVSIEDTSTDARPAVAPPGEAYPVIPTARSKAVTLDTAIDQVRENVQVMADLLQSVLDKKTVVSLRQSADNLQQVTKTLADNSDKLNSILASTERASRRLGPLLESSQETVKTLQGASHRLEPLLESSQETVRTLQGASHRLEPLLESSQDTVKALQTQVLPQTLKTLTDLDNLSGSFTDMATRISRDPSIVIRGSTRPAPGPGERN